MLMIKFQKKNITFKNSKYIKWWNQIDKWRARNCLKYKQSKKLIKPQYALQRLNSLTKDLNPFITTEVGQHQMWAAQFIEFLSLIHI